MKKLIDKQLTAYGLQLFIVVSCMLLVVSLFGCGQVQPSGSSISVAALQGTWYKDWGGGAYAQFVFTNSNYVFTASNGNNSSGTYSISGSTITFAATTGYDIGSRDATLSGNVLTLSSGGVSTDYTKQ